MKYRIIITCNGKKKKVLHKSDNTKSIKRKYFNIKDKNKVLFPKKTNAYKKTKPVNYELVLMKKWEDTDSPFIDRDSLGRTVEVKDKDKKWTILYKDDYFYEEKFNSLGFLTLFKENIVRVLFNGDNMTYYFAYKLKKY